MIPKFSLCHRAVLLVRPKESNRLSRTIRSKLFSLSLCMRVIQHNARTFAFSTATLWISCLSSLSSALFLLWHTCSGNFLSLIAYLAAANGKRFPTQTLFTKHRFLVRSRGALPTLGVFCRRSSSYPVSLENAVHWTAIRSLRMNEVWARYSPITKRTTDRESRSATERPRTPVWLIKLKVRSGRTDCAVSIIGVLSARTSY